MPAPKPCQHNPSKQCDICKREMRLASGKKTYQKRKKKDPDFLKKSSERGVLYYKINRSEIRKKIQAKRDAEPEKSRTAESGMQFDVRIAVLIQASGNRCEICHVGFEEGNDWNRVVDHAHTTKRVRGILCRRCNLLLGHSKDSIITLEGAIAYLNRYGFMGEN